MLIKARDNPRIEFLSVYSCYLSKPCTYKLYILSSKIRSWNNDTYVCTNFHEKKLTRVKMKGSSCSDLQSRKWNRISHLESFGRISRCNTIQNCFLNSTWSWHGVKIQETIFKGGASRRQIVWFETVDIIHTLMLWVNYSHHIGIFIEKPACYKYWIRPCYYPKHGTKMVRYLFQTRKMNLSSCSRHI